MEYRARSKREARRLVLEVIGPKLEASGMNWDIRDQMPSEREYERFLDEWDVMIREQHDRKIEASVSKR